MPDQFPRSNEPKDTKGFLATVTDNSIEANVLDGVHLAGSRVGLVQGNTIRANRKAAFPVGGSARAFFRENRVVGNPVRERVRSRGTQPGERAGWFAVPSRLTPSVL